MGVGEVEVVVEVLMELLGNQEIQGMEDLMVVVVVEPSLVMLLLLMVDMEQMV
jgi:hypothetical protein